MSNENIMPVRHGFISGTATTAAEAGKGAIKGMVKGGLMGLATMAVLGAAIVGGSAFLLGGGIVGLLVAAPIGAIAGGLSGLVVGGPLAAGIGTVLGTVFGVNRGMDRVGNERGAATMLDAQLQAYEAQAMAAQQATIINAPSAANNNYPTASTMNQAGTQIQRGTSQDMGMINGAPALQRA